MAGLGAHHTTNCYEHSVFVAYTSFLFCRFCGLDARAAARGGLLHDLFLYDRREKESYEGRHISAHPKAALDNAQRITQLSDKERDIIGKHMWPMTRPLPRYAESFVVSAADKLCATAEALWLYGLLRARRGLNFGAVALAAVKPV